MGTDYSWLEGIDLEELRSLCPILDVDTEFFDSLKLYQHYSNIGLDPTVRLKVYYSLGTKFLKEGLAIPFSELPLHLNRGSYSGLVVGIVKYRLRHGK